MVCFVWMIVVAKREAAGFAQGVTEKQLCDYRGNREDGGGRRMCVGSGGSQAALQGWQSVINFACVSLPPRICFVPFLKYNSLGRRRLSRHERLLNITTNVNVRPVCMKLFLNSLTGLGRIFFEQKVI